RKRSAISGASFLLHCPDGELRGAHRPSSTAASKAQEHRAAAPHRGTLLRRNSGRRILPGPPLPLGRRPPSCADRSPPCGQAEHVRSCAVFSSGPATGGRVASSVPAVLACRQVQEQTIGMATARTPWWAWTWPVLAWAILLLTPFAGPGGVIAAAAGAGLIATVFAAVYHAEVVAQRTGEPFGTLVLAVAVTVIEVALLVSVMLAAPAEKAGLARGRSLGAATIT